MSKNKNLNIFNGKPFSRKELEIMGFTGNHIQVLLKAGKIERLSHGIYHIPGDNLGDEENFRIASLRTKEKCAVCLLSALAFYHLTDVIPKKTWILVDFDKRSTSKHLRIFRSRNPHWRIGIIQEKGYKITSLERTLVDCLTYRRLIGTGVATEALRKAIRDRKTTLAKVFAVAKSLEADKRIFPYIEALS